VVRRIRTERTARIGAARSIGLEITKRSAAKGGEDPQRGCDARQEIWARQLGLSSGIRASCSGDPCDDDGGSESDAWAMAPDSGGHTPRGVRENDCFQTFPFDPRQLMPSDAFGRA
jgi:hypothetical protein